MAYKRYQLDLAFKLPLDPVLEGQLTAFEAVIRTVLRRSATKINAGLPNEEDTTYAAWHKCYHDESINKPCEPEEDI